MNIFRGLLILIFGLMLISAIAQFVPPIIAVIVLFLVIRAIVNSATQTQDRRFVNVERRGSNNRRTVQTQPQTRAYRPPAAPQRRKTAIDEAYDHAIKAAYDAGFDLDEDGVIPMDIGVLAYRANSDEPIIVREGEIPDDITHLQPFIDLRVPENLDGSVSFEILDASGNVVYTRRVQRSYKRGRNLILPPTRMRVDGDMELMDGWHLRVWSGEVMIADHTIDWMDAYTYNEKPLAAHIGEDGELSVELRNALDDIAQQGVSLDDLLADQDDDQKSARSK